MSDDAPAMTSHRPYLVRALYEWIADNGLTPHLLVDATQPRVQVPPHTIKDGKVVLNIAGRAVARLELGNDDVRFTARFGGVSHPIRVPIAAILAIYARETGQGMALPDDIGPGAARSTSEGDQDDGATAPDSPRPDDAPQAPPPKRGGHLHIVK